MDNEHYDNSQSLMNMEGGSDENEGSVDDKLLSNKIQTLKNIYEEILTTKDKFYFFFLIQFIIGNACIQIMYAFYEMKIGINTCIHKCVVIG